MLLSSFLSNFSQRFCDIVLARILGLGSLGIYNRATGLNNIVWGNIHYIASRVVLVEFSVLHRQAIPLGATYARTVAMVTATLWPLFAGLAVVAKPFIVTVYGRTWEAAATPLSLLAIASVIGVSLTMTWELFAATGNIRTQTRIELIRTPLSVLLFIVGCLISLDAAAFTRIIDAAIAFALYRPHINAMSGTDFSVLRGIYAQSMLLTLCAVIPAGVLVATSPAGEPPLMLLSIAITAGVVLWMAALFALKHPLYLEVRATLWRRRQHAE